MNMLKKFSMITVFGVLGATSVATPANAATVFGVTVPDLTTLTAEISNRIAQELKAQLRMAINAPRQPRGERAPSVVVLEREVVVVEASRLPPLDGSQSGEVLTAQNQHPVRF